MQRKAHSLSRILTLLLVLNAAPAAFADFNVTAVQLVSGWPVSPPTELHADAQGPFWTYRTGELIILERYGSGRPQELSRVAAKPGYPNSYFLPELVLGPGQPEMFYRLNNRLFAQNSAQIDDAMGYGSWEFYAAARNTSSIFAAAFGIIEEEYGQSFVAIVPPGGTGFRTTLREANVGVWSPVALLSETAAYVVYRGRNALTIESMPVADLINTKAWRGQRWEYKPSEKGLLYGDPTACLGYYGYLHWAAQKWTYHDPSGLFMVDGQEIYNQKGFTGHVDWVPEIRSIKHYGVFLSIAAPNGNALIGHVVGNQFQPIAELPSRAPAYADPPPTHMAAFGRSLYVSTSAGLWRLDFTTVRQPGLEVPSASWGVSLLAIGAFAALLRMRRARSGGR